MVLRRSTSHHSGASAVSVGVVGMPSWSVAPSVRSTGGSWVRSNLPDVGTMGMLQEMTVTSHWPENRYKSTFLYFCSIQQWFSYIYSYTYVLLVLIFISIIFNYCCRHYWTGFTLGFLVSKSRLLLLLVLLLLQRHSHRFTHCNLYLLMPVSQYAQTALCYKEHAVLPVKKELTWLILHWVLKVSGAISAFFTLVISLMIS